ncbi:hypothetical protein [Microbacterium sp. SLBN-146]|uniref:hypothetical protein n=1 Tax=Microbacterium sp. SLBN-146 TaxID=2768457 RepID=UPI001153226E|nr:hypothetical protein [Microbacterium sp. SLBN-146]TQJ31718.1 hypothetical protein FBY39_2200 [Microbacterium sp. SLBN-146]
MNSRSAPTDAGSLRPGVARVLQSEEAVYGLILVSGMIVVSNSLVGTSINALLTVVVTVFVFFCAHVYAGTLARLAATDGAAGFGPSLVASAKHSLGMLIAAVPPLVVLLLGVTRVFPDDTAIWAALILDTALLAVLGWFAVSRWTVRVWPRILSAVITAGFGVILVALKALIHH